MAMKKKFLGLALAAAVALPATGVYANGTTSNGATHNLIQSASPQDQSVETTIPVNGEVLNSENKSGKIQVEIPTAMAFAVKSDSKIEGTQYEVRNLGADSIDISVASFTKSTGNIDIHTATEISDDAAGGTTYTRKDVSLILNGSANDGKKSVDLGKINQGQMSENKVATIPANSNQTITLTGTAGTKTDQNLNKSGTDGSFNLSFRISKTA